MPQPFITRIKFLEVPWKETRIQITTITVHVAASDFADTGFLNHTLCIYRDKIMAKRVNYVFKFRINWPSDVISSIRNWKSGGE